MDPIVICPKCAYERREADRDFAPPTECPRCGIIYEKFLAAKAAAPKTAPAGPAPPWTRLWARFRYVPDKVDSMDVLGRSAVWILLLLWGAWFLRYPFYAPAIGASFLHRIHLVFHEAGHVLF